MQRPIRLIVADDHCSPPGLKSLLRSSPRSHRRRNQPRRRPAGLLERRACDLVLLDLQMERNTLADIESARSARAHRGAHRQRVPRCRRGDPKGARARWCSSASRSDLDGGDPHRGLGNVWLPPACRHTGGATAPAGMNRALAAREQVVRHVALGMRNAEAAKPGDQRTDRQGRSNSTFASSAFAIASSCTVRPTGGPERHRSGLAAPRSAACPSRT